MAATTHLKSDQFLAMPEEFDQRGNRINELLTGKFHAHPHFSPKALVEVGAHVGISDALMPDFSLVKRRRLSSETRSFQGSPDLAIAVVSPSVLIHTREIVPKWKANQSIADPSFPASPVPSRPFLS